MNKYLTFLFLIYYGCTYGQVTTGEQEIYNTVKAITKGRFFASREMTSDTLITYCYKFNSKEFFRAICQSRKENGRIDNQALTYDFYFQKGKLIMATVGRWKGKVFSTYYFKDDQLFRRKENNQMPLISEKELLDKAQSLLSKKQEYLLKSKFG